MKLLEKILVPIDVNRDHKVQLSLAIKLAKEFDSEVTVLYVLPDNKIHPETKSLVTKYLNELLDNAIKVMKTESITCTPHLIEMGNPVDKILQIATEQNSNLILVGSGSKTREETFKLGTTAEKLIQLSDVPVWVVKTDQKIEIKKILCPVDFSDASKRALKNAIMLSKNFDSTVHILGVFEPFFSSSPRLKIDHEKENRMLKLEFEHRMNEFLGELDLTGVNHSIDIQMGLPHKKILDSIKEEGTDLLVMGTNGRSGLSRIIMGSVTEKVIRELPCSFVTTKTQNIFQLKFDLEIKGIEIHFKNAEKLQKNGFYKEAIEQCLICLKINDMHIPSMYKLSKLHKILGNDDQADYYEKMATDLLRRLWDKKIEMEIRQHYRPKN